MPLATVGRAAKHGDRFVRCALFGHIEARRDVIAASSTEPGPVNPYTNGSHFPKTVHDRYAPSEQLSFKKYRNAIIASTYWRNKKYKNNQKDFGCRSSFNSECS